MTIVDAGNRKPLELEVVVPVDDMGRLGEPVAPEPVGGGGPVEPVGARGGRPVAERTSIWPAVHPRLLELVRATAPRSCS